jgi:hypothetical protein
MHISGHRSWSREVMTMVRISRVAGVGPPGERWPLMTMGRISWVAWGLPVAMRRIRRPALMRAMYISQGVSLPEGAPAARVDPAR